MIERPGYKSDINIFKIAKARPTVRIKPQRFTNRDLENKTLRLQNVNLDKEDEFFTNYDRRKKISTNHGKRGFIRIELRSSTRNMPVIQNVKWSIGFVKMSSLRF